MKKANLILTIAIITASSLVVSALPNSTPCPPGVTCRYKPYIVNDAESHKGDKVSGPRTVVITNVNIVRYDVKIGTEVAFTAGPDLSGLGFMPTGPKSQDKAADVKAAHAQNAAIANAANLASGVPSIDQQFKQLENDLSQDEGLMATTVQGAIAISTALVNDASSGVQDLVSSSDSVLGTASGPATLVAQISPVNTRVARALLENWPITAIVSLANKLTRLKSDADNLRGEPGWQEWYKANGAAYELLKARVAELQSELKAVDQESDAAKKFEQTKSKLRQWNNFLSSVKEPDFTRTIDVDCGFAFDQTKSNKITLVKHDKLAAAGAKDITEEIVTVECTTPFSISGGIGFSSVDEGEFVFVSSKPPAGGTAPINTFGFKNRSSFRTIPLVLINTRLKEWNDTIALHASAGAGVDIKTGQPAAGTDIEYIVGGSLSFKRSFFVTTGVHVGRVSTLAGGFNIGDTVPSGLSAPPIEKTWKPGFIVAFTYKIK